MTYGYHRDFMILENEDSGYEAGQRPTGYLKIEVREGKGKLEASIQNLKRSNGSFEYKIYLIRNKETSFATVCVGKLNHGMNKAELSWTFDPLNVARSGYKIKDFDIGAVIVEYTDRKKRTVICPLAAYKSKKSEWRKSFEKKAYGTKQDFDLTYGHVGNLIPEESNEETNIDKGIYENNNANAAGEIITSDEIIKDIYENEEKAEKAEAAEKPEDAENAWDNKVTCETAETTSMPIEKATENVENEEAAVKAVEEEQQSQMQWEEEGKEEYSDNKQDQGGTVSDTGEKPNYNENYNSANYNINAKADMDEKTSNNVDINCIYLNANICGAFINNSADGAIPCNNCQMHKASQPPKKMAGGDVARLREELGRFFELSDPFNSRRTDYTWWRVTNPVNLNNILYQCNIRSPLLFNPAVMMAHYRYRHLIIGIFHHKDTQKEYVVCGVPGMNMVDRKPFGDAGRWVQVEGNRPRYGAFGYWIIYIDPEDGRILTV